MRAWIEATAQVEYHQVCSCMLALARAAIGRLASRDGDAGTAPAGRPTLSEAKFAERSSALRTAWLAAEQLVPGGGPLGRLGRLMRITSSFVEPVLLALAVAPLLDRGVARGYARLEPEPMTAGLLLDLASATEASRLALSGALHPDAALRRHALILAGDPDCVAAVGADTAIAVAPSVLSVLRCEPVPLPRGVEELAPVPIAGVAARVLEALGVAPVQPGDVVVLAGSAAQSEALARLLAGASSALVWRLGLEDGAEPAWAGLMRDAALANAICVVAATAGGTWLRRLRWAADRSLLPALCVVPGNPVPAEVTPLVDVAAVVARADLAHARALASDPVTADLVARLVQR